MSHLFHSFEIAECSREEKTGVLALIVRSVELCVLARREGLLAIEEVLDTMPTPFYRDLMQMVVDGVDPEQVSNLAWARIAANGLHGATLLEAMVTLEAIHVLSKQMLPAIAGAILSSYLGKDRDLYVNIMESLDLYPEPVPEPGTDYFGLTISAEEIIQKVVESRQHARDEQNPLRVSRNPGQMFARLAPVHLALVHRGTRNRHKAAMEPGK